MKQQFPLGLFPGSPSARTRASGRGAALAGAALAGLLVAGCAGPRSATKAPGGRWLAPVTETPTRQWHPGKFVWHDLLTPDAARARAFYGGLFGWTFTTKGPYTIIRNQNRRIGGVVEVKQPEDPAARALWVGSLSVPDVDEAVAFLESEGGKTLSGPADMGPRGRGALVSDPQGAQLVLLHSATGDPPDTPPAPGEWLWDELWTARPADTIAFYQTLAGYDSLVEVERYTVFVRDGKWRAGVRHVFREDFRARWVPVVRVRDPGAILGRVSRLGGRVWVRPDDPASNGESALISDPAGAFLIVQRWTR